MLPLFPLNVVLLPGAPLPLHIFEERYKLMIGEAIRDGTEFGVVLASEKGIVNMGCTAVVAKVVQRYTDGRLDVLTTGRRRFEIHRLNDELPYLRGEVEYFDDEDIEPTPLEVVERTVEAYRLYCTAEGATPSPTPPGPRMSFELAQQVNDLDVRQVLLATRSEAQRMKQMADFFVAQAVKSRESTRVKELASSNGHARPLAGL